jgi:ADP-ribose pyrophosphatase YjhB (NUDIX family)
MKSKEVLDRIRNLSNKEKREISYDELVSIIDELNPDEIIELSNIIGYPVFTRLCMGVLKHKFVLLQDGAAAIIINDKGQILLQSRADNERWGLPGGCQELGERFEDTVIREIKEETNLDVTEDNLELLAIVSGNSRRNEYPNGDVVINNTALFVVRNYTGELKYDVESKDMKFFDLDNLPVNQNDPDLINIYRKSLNRGRV